MPLYVVRWPNLSAALVRAEDEVDLIDILDEEANPSGCRWEVYHGPLFVDFALAASMDIEPRADGGEDTGERPLDPARIRIVEHEDLAARAVSPTHLRPGGESGVFMVEEVCRFAFPAMAAVYYDGEYEDIDPSVLQAALREDAMYLVEYSWRRSQMYRSDDPEAQLAVLMDASPQWLRAMRERAANRDGKGDSDDGQEANFIVVLQGERDDDIIDFDELDDDEFDDDEFDDDDDDDEELTVDEAIGELLDGASELWTLQGDPDSLRGMLGAVMDLLDRYEDEERVDFEN